MLKLLSIRCLLFLMFCFPLQCLPYENKVIHIGIVIPEYVLVDFSKWTKSKSCWLVNEFDAKPENRAAVELIILCKALNLGGLNFEFNVLKSVDYNESKLFVQQKKAYIQGESVWKDQANTELFHISPAILRKGEFSKGIYTLQGHPMLKTVKNLQSLQRYRGITVPAWEQDWYMLRQITKNLLTAKSQFEIYDRIKKGRADFTLGEFSSELTMVFGKMYLYPVPDIKIIIAQSRHFAVRKGMPHSTEIFEALSLGIAKMRSTKMIVDLFNRAGIINSTTDHWKIITTDLDTTDQP
ncbi:hypothetical protein L0668_14575 [Paraglaciecola aquimarina]|uniref:Solute-binding protein family 3/N-terminal domain-containing protein n=1 Tax=Paraglaciecola algarum TaxID=3050085 RepID=A0ABS9D8Z0_9ALTE|nr:hypothetical protein [Paraglaciecola sp. G1-23]MCF2949341.1 hypothetical protein [Paraglaciecola sp. G1-23]